VAEQVNGVIDGDTDHRHAEGQDDAVDGAEDEIHRDDACRHRGQQRQAADDQQAHGSIAHQQDHNRYHRRGDTETPGIGADNVPGRHREDPGTAHAEFHRAVANRFANRLLRPFLGIQIETRGAGLRQQQRPLPFSIEPYAP
jgi:hypothetical protein